MGSTGAASPKSQRKKRQPTWSANQFEASHYETAGSPRALFPVSKFEVEDYLQPRNHIKSPRMVSVCNESSRLSLMNKASHCHFQHMLDEKLMDFRDWAVAEHDKQLVALQVENDKLRSQIVARCSAPLTPTTTPRKTPRLAGSPAVGQVAQDSACDELDDDERNNPQIQDRWNRVLQKVTSPAWRMLNREVKKKGRFELHEVWAAQRKHVVAHDDRCSLSAYDILEQTNGKRNNPNLHLQLVGDHVPVIPLQAFRCSMCIRVCWRCFRLMLVLYDVIMAPVLTFFTMEYSEFEGSMSTIGRIFWTLDLAVNLMDGGATVTNRSFSKSAMDYVRGWLLFDSFIVLSNWLLFILAKEGGSLPSILRVLCLSRWFQVLPWGRFLDVIANAFLVDCDVVIIICRMLKAIAALAIGIHIWACLWYGISRAESDGWAHEVAIESRSVSYQYLLSIQWATNQVHGTSSSGMIASSKVEQAFCAFSTFCGCILFSFFVAKVTHALILMKQVQHHLYEVEDICDRFCNTNNMPRELSSRAQSYLALHNKQLNLSRRIEQDDHFLAMLPKSLRMDMKAHALGQLCMNIEFFKVLGFFKSRVVRKICEHAVSVVLSLAEEIVFAEGDECHRVYIVQGGVFAYVFGRTEKWKRRMSVTTDLLAGGSSDLFKNTNNADLLFSHEREDEVLLRGMQICEAVLWTKWTHAGDLTASCDSTLLALDPEAVTQAILERKDATSVALQYAARFVSTLNEASEHSDLFCYKLAEDTGREESEDMICNADDHLIFLSHFKAEAGTEATLMHEALERMIANDASYSAAANLRSPVFLDSTNLSDLNKLKSHVAHSHNLALLLTPGVLTRPWCLLEICLAVSKQTRVIPVEVQRPGLAFSYPQEDFYKQLRSGLLLNKESVALLREHGFSLTEVEAAIRHVFMQIALPFSPHKTQHIREAELNGILQRCSTREASNAPQI